MCLVQNKVILKINLINEVLFQSTTFCELMWGVLQYEKHVLYEDVWEKTYYLNDTHAFICWLNLKGKDIFTFELFACQ